MCASADDACPASHPLLHDWSPQPGRFPLADRHPHGDRVVQELRLVVDGRVANPVVINLQ
jgi:hypothetical protein